MAGDDVPNKKPDPSIYKIAAERLEVDPSECLVIEDSTIGLQAGPSLQIIQHCLNLGCWLFPADSLSPQMS